MKTKNLIVIFLIATSIVSCAPAATVAPRADNFAFVFGDTPCGPVPVNVLDTANDTLVHTPLGDTTSITISLRLTDAELEAVYQKSMSIGFFDYPSKFIVPDDQTTGQHFPASSYQLSVINGDMINSVTWTDNIITKPGYKRADQLRELMELIKKIILAHPEIQPLPGPKLLCG